MAAGAIAFFVLDLQRYLSWEELSRQRYALLDWRERHEVLSVFLFIGAYVLGVAVSLPGADEVAYEREGYVGALREANSGIYGS